MTTPDEFTFIVIETLEKPNTDISYVFVIKKYEVKNDNLKFSRFVGSPDILVHK